MEEAGEGDRKRRQEETGGDRERQKEDRKARLALRLGRRARGGTDG